jgi:mutator protein MutT
VVAALVHKGDSILLCRRSSGGSQGLWELPGGKLEPGETPREGLIREISEELSLSCKPGQLIYEGILPAAGKQYQFMVFETTLSALPVASNAHDLLAWVTRDQLEEYELAPLDVPVLGDLMGNHMGEYQAVLVDQTVPDLIPRVQYPSESKGGRN